MIDTSQPRFRGGEHAEHMLQELVEEKRLGRVVGPARAPDHWPTSLTWTPSKTPRRETSSRLPPCTILQEDEHGHVKIRREGQGPRHPHAPPGHQLRGAGTPHGRRAGRHTRPGARLAQRLPPEAPATFLATSYGITLWFRLAMCFGAAASVWKLNRTADALQLLTRILLLLMGGHYVDDFNEYDEVAPSDFHAFADVFNLFGLQVKESPGQPARHTGSQL